jgi:hypothetical protein
MAIANRPKAKSTNVAFVAGTPDAPRQRWQRGKKTQITLPISPELLAKVDEAAARRYVTRAALIAMWLGDRLAQERGDRAA